MRSEALDITIVARNDTIWLQLAGPFHNEQAPNIREKILGLVQDGNKDIIIDLEQVTDLGTAVVPEFLHILNMVREKAGDVRFIFRNESVSKAFGPYRNLFTIFPDVTTAAEGGVRGMLRRRARILFRKTGVRLSRPVAIFVLFILCGWFLSLIFIIYLQSQRLGQQAAEIRDLTQYQQNASVQMAHLRDRIRPMEQLGLLPDTTLAMTPEATAELRRAVKKPDLEKPAETPPDSALN